MPPYDPNKDPALKGKPSPSTTEQQVSTIDAQVAEAKRQGKTKAKKQARQANTQIASSLSKENDSSFSPLAVLSAIPATVAAATTPDDYLVGRQGSGEAPKKVGDMSLIDQVLGEDQLSLADPLKALVFKDKKDLQQKYLAGEADTGTNVTMKILEAVGLGGDIVLDPLNLIGGIGVADDAFAGLAKGAKLEASAAKLAERAAVDGADSWAAKGAKLLDDHHALLDSIDGQLAAGAVDDITAAGLKEEAANAFRDAYGELNGQALLAGDTVLAESRFLPGKLIHEAGFGAKSRASLITERATELQKDIAKAVGPGLNPMETGSTLRLPVFGGRTADEMVTDAWAKGFGGLSEDARKAMGITGRIHRFNKADFLSGRAFNPFASSASATMEGGFLMNTPGAFIRSNSIKGGTNLVEKGADLLRPTMGRASKIWRAAFELSDGGQEAAERAMTRLKKVLGPDAVAKVEDQFLNYPLTVMNEARLDGLIRAGGKRLAVAGAKTQQEIGSRLLQETEQDATKWTLRGSDDVVTPVWSRVQQSNFEAVDSAISGAGGSLKTSLAGALRDSMVRLDIPLNLDEVLPGESISKISAEVFSRVINDSEFADDIGRIFQQNMRRMTEKGVTKGDLLRATLNALSTAATISKETSGVFDWVEAMTKVGAAKELFSSSGAEALGREAKLFSYMEDMGLAVLYRAEQGELSTDEIHALINQLADDYTGVAVRYTDTFDRVLEAKAELRRGLKLRGVTEEKIVQIEDDIAQNVMDRDGMTAVLDEARAAADEARGDLQVTGDVLREQQSALRDIERTVQKLEETHLALLGYRDLETQLKSKLTELERAAMAVDLVTVDVRPFIERLDQLTTTDFLADTFPTGGSPWLGVPQQRDPRPAFLLNQALADTPKGINAGVRQQEFNRSLRLAREMFGDSVELDQLAKHGALASSMTEGYGMTEGALNTATIARFFEQSADPRVTEAANKFGGWETLLRTQDEAQISEVKRVAANLANRRENQIARDLARQASGEVMVIAPKLTRYGVTGQALTEFMLNTMADRVEAITPLVDELVDALSVGPIERIEALFAGNEKGLDIARQMMSGDFSHLNALVTELARGLDIAIGVPGGFGDAGTFQLMRELIMADPRKYAIFTRAKEVFEGIENASLLTHAAADATETHVYLTDEIDAILGVMPNGRILENRKADLIDEVVSGRSYEDLAGDPEALGYDMSAISSGRAEVGRQQKLYHGTARKAGEKDLDRILPAAGTGNNLLADLGFASSGDAYATVSLDEARQYAQRAASLTGGEPVVYEVTGAGAKNRLGNEVYAPSFKVKRVVGEDEVQQFVGVDPLSRLDQGLLESMVEFGMPADELRRRLDPPPTGFMWGEDGNGGEDDIARLLTPDEERDFWGPGSDLFPNPMGGSGSGFFRTGAPDMGQMAKDVAVTAEQRAQIREVLKEASKRVRSTRSRIETMGRQSEKWRVALDEKLTDLNVIDGWIYNYQQLVDDQMSTVAMFDQQLQREAAVISGTPVIANILGASADVRVVKNGFIEFAQDPKVSFKTLADGSVVRRSDDEIMALWDRRIEGAAKWTEILRDRAVNGYMTKGGREVPAINRYAYAKGLEKEWMLARAEEGFSGVWHHAALADGGGAGAMIALATNYPRRNGNEAVAAWEMLTSMLKSGYVGTPAFSVRNLTGALLENVRQGINPLVSKKVWAADSVARGLEGMISFVNTIEEEAVAKEYRKLIQEAQDAVEKHFGSDVYGSVVEARHVGVTDSIFQFQEISGMAPGEEGTNTFRGMLRSWGKAIRDTRHVARRETEARFGDEPLLRSLAGVTGAVQAVPTHPARYFEQALAGSIESRARGKIWKQVFSDPEMVRKMTELEKLAEPFTARPGVEALVRVDLYAQRRLAGDSTEMAFNRMMASHFDYTDLSSADEAMKKIMPFWIWRSRSMVHYAEMLSAKPSTLGHTFRIWEDQHRSKDPRAPRYTTEVGGGFDPASFLGLAVPDPAADVIGLKDQVSRGWGESGVLGALTEPAKQVVTNDLVTLVSVPATAFSGYTPEGIPIDTPASIQGPLSVIANAPGGSAVVEKFAYRGKGDKWYWRYPGASYVFGEILPMMSNVVKITQPVEDGDGIAEKTFGAIARFFGTPVRLVPAAEQERARRATMIRRRIAAQEQQRRGG